MGGGVERREEENERECEREYSLQAERRNSSVYWRHVLGTIYYSWREGEEEMLLLLLMVLGLDVPW